MARWRYVVPNAITCFSLSLGLVSMGHAMAGDHLVAAWLIVLSVLLDKLDGTAARLLGATSRIGVQLDSLSDFVTFGIAPAFIVYAKLHGDPVGPGDVWSGEVGQLALMGLLIAYTLMACIRLAKFNVLNDVLPAGGPKVFYGLPSTFAGGLVVVVFIIGLEYGADDVLRWLPAAALGLGLLMVSNLPLPKLAKRDSVALNVFQGVNIVIGYTCGVFRFWPEYILGAVLLYALVGLSWGLLHRRELMPPRLDPYPQ